MPGAIEAAHRAKSIRGCLEYPFALLLAGAATLIQLATRPAIHEVPFAFYYLAVLIATWVGGAGPGLVALAISAAAGNYLFLEPQGAPTLHGAKILPMAAFGAVGSILIALTATTRSRFREREKLLEEARAANIERLAALEGEQRARAAAEEANRTKDEFLAMLGHEMRNPLAPIFAALELIRRKGAGERAREIAIIQRQAGQLGRLVDDLLDIARIAQGKVDLAPERLEVAAVVDQCCEMAAPLIQAKKHVLKVDVPAGLFVLADRARLAQALGNVLLNAAKYTDSGGEISVTAARRDGDVVLAVRDNGEGMSPELLENVFEPFVQGPRGLDRAQGGLGLGLALSRKLLRLQGGDVIAHSDGSGQGTEVVLILPGAS